MIILIIYYKGYYRCFLIVMTRILGYKRRYRYHAEFKISVSGETLTLSAPKNADGTDGAMLDTVTVPVLETDETYGRYKNGTGSYATLTPTPKLSNDKAEKIVHVAEPVFSKAGGFYADGFSLTLSDTNGSTILYTTDGSDPTTSETAKTYSKAIKIYDNTNDTNKLASDERIGYDSSDDGKFPTPQPADFNVDKGMVIKAVCRDKDGNFSHVSENGYYINKSKAYYQDMKVISISADASCFFGDETLYRFNCCTGFHLFKPYLRFHKEIGILLILPCIL